MDHVLAIDLGASGGRVIRGTWDASAAKLKLEEIHRFANEPVEVLGTLHWDTLRLWFEIQKGVREAVRTLPKGERIRSLAVDTWGVDFGLLDAHGRLLGNPVHYRDKRTEGQVAKLTAQFGEGELFRRAGTQDEWFNTIGQLRGALERDPHFLAGAKALLFSPDLFNYFFSGLKAAERTIASTSQLLQAGKTSWDNEILAKLGVPAGLMQAVREPGTLLGPVLPAVAAELGLTPDTQVALVPSHDTESAALAVPTTSGKPFAFISCGTWAVLGAELSAPVTSEAARLAKFSNEAGAFGTNLLLSNIMGMWLVQECKRWWERDGKKFGHAELVDWAAQAPWGGSLIDVNDPLFSTPGDMPGRLVDYCMKKGLPVPEGRGAVVRCVLESLACEFRRSLETMEKVTGQAFAELWLVGGGSQNQLLCQLTADLTGRTVLTGPIETTALGNIAAQFVALGTFGSAREARQAVSSSFGVSHYEPGNRLLAADTYRRWLAVTSSNG
ncbi:MAG: rhamnulokinase family protein [Spirochaetales bacterium]